MSRRWIIALVTLLTLAGALATGTTTAQAHAIVLRSDPPDGAVLAAAPQQLRLWLSEPVALDFTTIELIDSAGRRTSVTAHSDAASLALTVRGASTSTSLLLIDLPALPPSAYRLSWRTLSSGDLHVTSGSIVFGVQRAANLAPVAAAATAPPLAEVLLRWLNFSALATLIGALALALLILPMATTNRRPPTTDHRPNIAHLSDGPSVVAVIQRRHLRLALGATLLALVVGSGLLLAQAAAAPDQTAMLESAWWIVAGTSSGTRWLLRQGLLVALGAAITFLLRETARTAVVPLSALIHPLRAAPTTPRPVPPSPHAAPFLIVADERSRVRLVMSGLVAILILALVITQALNSHAAAFNELSPVRVLADALHLLAAGIWCGGLLALAVAILPLLRGGHAERALAWSVLRRFGRLAAAALAALLITGLFMTGQQVASLDALLTTLYGQTLLLKIGLALGAALIGLRNAAALHPRVAQALRRAAAALTLRPPLSGVGEGWRGSAGVRGSGRIARTVPIEGAGAGLVLLLAAVLSATAPARGPAFDPPAEESAPSTITTRADDLIISLSIKPNQPGQNFLSLGVFDTRRPAPAPIDRVTVRLQGPGERQTDALLAAEALGGGRYQIAGDAIDTEGDWRISIVVSRHGLPETVATISWNVLPLAQAVERRPTLISNRPLAPALTLAALLVALALLGAGALLRLRRRPTAAPQSPIRQQTQPASIKEKRARP